MKRSEMVQNLARHLMSRLDWSKEDRLKFASELLSDLEIDGMVPEKHINPRAIEEFGDIIEEKGKHWGYAYYVSKYTNDYFDAKGRPYEYYVEGWEPEGE